MSAGSSASEQKAQYGETKAGKQSAVSKPEGTNLSVGTAGLGDKVEGQPQLTRNKGGQVVSYWNSVMVGHDVRILERILSQVKNDKDYDLIPFIRSIEYQGFDREFYIKHCLTKMSVSLFVRFAILGALRGSNFTRIQETCDGVPQDMLSAFTNCGFVKTPKKRVDITILRNTASIPHWCAFWFLKSGVARKVTDNECPVEIQFPGAASLPMSRKVRISHIEFCQKFSMLLPGGKFNFNIYLTAYNNQIPVKDIPQEVLSILQVSSNSESYRISDDEASTYSKSVVKI